MQSAAGPIAGICAVAHHLSGMADVTVWYDGSCPLCSREIALIRRLDRRGSIRFVDVAQAGPAACPIGREALLARFHAMENGRLLSGAEAFAAMWRAVPALRPFGRLFARPSALIVLERLYRMFLRLRPGLQRLARKGEPRR